MVVLRKMRKVRVVVWRWWRHRTHGVRTELLLTGAAIVVLMMLILPVSTLLRMLVTWKRQLAGVSVAFFELGLLSSGQVVLGL